VDLPANNFMTRSLLIQSRSHPYQVECKKTFEEAIYSISDPEKAFFLVDAAIARLHGLLLAQIAPLERTLEIDPTESQKSFEALTPIFLDLLQRGLKRDSNIVVIGGGVLQDIGCFIASVLSRGLRWELVPTTLLAQADSCIGSKSSINVGPYKNQVGTFYPPHRVLLSTSVLASLPEDEIRSGLGEIIKLQLIAGEAQFQELMTDLATHAPYDSDFLEKWVLRSLEVKLPFIEKDEFDTGIRNILNYGHTFGHAYESATQYEIPHGIAVILGILTATHLSVRLGLVGAQHYAGLKSVLKKWHEPFGERLKAIPIDSILNAIKRDKKNTANSLHCILTRGAGRMEKLPVRLEDHLIPAISTFLTDELK
jgi:3-dehydroquinate synthase